MSWRKWEPLGGQIIGPPAAIAFKSPFLDVFARGIDNQLWQKAWRKDRWVEWHRPDGENFLLDSSPTVASTGNDLQVYARGTDGQLWAKVWIDRQGWRRWEPMGGQIIGAPTAISFKNIFMDVFARGIDNQLWQKAWRKDRWVEWHRPDGENFVLDSSPVVASTGNDLQVYARGTDGQLWAKVWVDRRGWRSWQPLGGQIIGAPTALFIVSFKNQLFDVFARGTDNQLWQKAWRTNHWVEWHRPDGENFALDSSPAVASTGNDYQVYARGTDGQLWRKVWVDPPPLKEFTTLFTLHADSVFAGVQTYAGGFPGSLIMAGEIKAINIPVQIEPYTVSFLKPGFSSTDLNNENAWITVGSGSSLTGENLKLFLDPQRKQVAARAASSKQIATQLLLTVTYTSRDEILF
ncbi:hypothetical protein EXU57_06450 [Segetibacter sp. 3557_3]|uniref:DUF346 domain-containing protein n=1 Tax=Segetibacter sp. 3557_3 TaxID=2547429 RepID=UPI001058DD07|nr:DUF346 domain-containing protein [Segetibacter sp. 3557_3]TDH28095.1 hypothetical protein EXU57_06450 [Segetibacter sp. 3557_3]